MNFQHSIDWFWHRVERKKQKNKKQQNKTRKTKNRVSMRENKTDENNPLNRIIKKFFFSSLQ